MALDRWQTTSKVAEFHESNEDITTVSLLPSLSTHLRDAKNLQLIQLLRTKPFQKLASHLHPQLVHLQIEQSHHGREHPASFSSCKSHAVAAVSVPSSLTVNIACKSSKAIVAMSLPPESLAHLACPESSTRSACEPSKVIAATSVPSESKSQHEVNVNMDERAKNGGQVTGIIDVCPLPPTV